MKASRTAVNAFILIAVSASVSLAAGPQSVSTKVRSDLIRAKEAIHNEGLREDPRYKQAMEICKGNSAAINQVTASSLKEVVEIGMLEVPVIARAINNKGVPAEVVHLLESEAFQLAMRECGNIDGTMNAISFADYKGKAVGMLANYFLYRSGYIVIKQMQLVGGMAMHAANTLTVAMSYYAGKQILELSDILWNKEKKKAEIQAKAEQKAQEINQGVDNLEERTKRAHIHALTELDKQLANPQLNAQTRTALTEQRERIAALLILRGVSVPRLP